MANLKSSEATFGSYQYWADMKLHQFAAAHNFGEVGAFGLAARILNIGDLIETTEAMPEGTGNIIKPRFTVVTMGWARRMNDRVSLGINLNLLSEKIKDMSATGWAADFGVQVETPMTGLSFGIVLKNYGPVMEFDGYGGTERVDFRDDEEGAASRVVKPQFAPFDLPSTFQFGLAYDAIEDPLNRLTFYGTYQANHSSSDEYRFGSEYAFRSQVFLRTGYVYASQLESNQEYLYSWAGGVGFKLDLGANNVYVDWSYNPNELFDASQWWTLRFEF